MSSSPLIPREKLSAYQRWELHTFDLPCDAQPPTRTAPAPPPTTEAAQRESLRRSAYDSGRAEGLREGVLKAADDARCLQELVATLGQQSRDINQQLADDLLGLALKVARQLVRQSLSVHPELIMPLLKDALARMSGASAQLTLTLHPADAALVRHHLAAQIESENWHIVEDAAMQRGGAVLQTATSQVDATLGTRWHHLTATLGLDDKWID